MRKGNQYVGTVECEDCGRVNEWYYIIADNYNSGKFHTHIIDKTKAAATLTEGTREEPNEFRIYCKNDKCDRPIFFQYNGEEN